MQNSNYSEQGLVEARHQLQVEKRMLLESKAVIFGVNFRMPSYAICKLNRMRTYNVPEPEEFMNRDSVSMTMTKEKEYVARRSLWYLYSIEVVHSIRDGMPPVSSGCATLFVQTPLTV